MRGLAANSPSIEERFWAKVETTETCWIWRGAINNYGYGNFGGNRWSVKAHRFAYELLVGPIPEGLVLDHLCRVRNCVNPGHLRAVTSGENVLAEGSLSPVRKNWLVTECAQGHPYDEVNTRVDRKGHRHCRACRSRWNREYRAKAGRR